MSDPTWDMTDAFPRSRADSTPEKAPNPVEGARHVFYPKYDANICADCGQGRDWWGHQGMSSDSSRPDSTGREASLLTLVAALDVLWRDYCSHDEDCPAMLTDDREPCNCGFSDAMKAIRAAREARQSALASPAGDRPSEALRDIAAARAQVMAIGQIAHEEACGVVVAKREHGIWLDCTCRYAERLCAAGILAAAPDGGCLFCDAGLPVSDGFHDVGLGSRGLPCAAALRSEQGRGGPEPSVETEWDIAEVRKALAASQATGFHVSRDRLVALLREIDQLRSMVDAAALRVRAPTEQSDGTD